MNQAYITKSDVQTQGLGEKFAKELRPGDIVLLYGDLGFGKTTFVKGIALGLGIKSRIISPTYVLVRSHRTVNQESGIMNLFHIDLYRVDSAGEIEGIGLKEILEDKNSVKLIEWPEKLKTLPDKRWDIVFEMNSESTRTILLNKREESFVNPFQIEEAIKEFKDGKVVIFPTDTAYGIGCRMDDISSVKKIYAIRKRQESKPFLVLVSDMDMAKQYVEFNEKSSEFLKKQWPGGVTLILPCKKDLVPSIVRAGGKTLAMRIPKHEELLEIIKTVGVPVIAPSANFAGEPTPYSLPEVNEKLLDQAGYIIEGDCTYSEESTIIDTTVDPWEVVREGAVKISIK